MVCFKHKQRNKKPQLNLETFQCKLLQKVELNQEKQENKSNQDSDQALNIGSAWSGINIRSDQKPIYFYGTEHGFAVKLSIEEKQSTKKQYEIQNNVFKIFDYDIEKKQQNEIENQVVKVDQKKTVVSTSDELSFIDYITGKVVQLYRISNIFQQEQLNCSSSVQIFLFNFVSPEVVLIGGSFPYLLFFEWQSGKVIKKYNDQSQFVGSFIHNNLLYLTHEKVSDITILY
ncbi:hypothetical protein ABPG74_020506 [Tetrahymena malaccensis]